MPTLVIHGDADEIIPFWMGSHLASTIARARFFPVAEGHHGDLFLLQRERILDALGTLVRDG